MTHTQSETMLATALIVREPRTVILYALYPIIQLYIHLFNLYAILLQLVGRQHR
jgi:hypothetical protein